jgi:hypothetical protein
MEKISASDFSTRERNTAQNSTFNPISKISPRLVFFPSPSLSYPSLFPFLF